MKINGDLVVLNMVNSVMLAFRWGLVALVATTMFGVGIRTWPKVGPRKQIVEQRVGLLPLTAEEAGAMEDRKEASDGAIDG